jgi:hypothetical protein
MKVLHWAFSYGLSLDEARHFTEKEKENYADWYKDLGLVGTGTTMELENLNVNTPEVQDILSRESIGSFKGCANNAYEITDEEWEALAELNRRAGVEEEIKQTEDDIARCQSIIDHCSRIQLHTAEEAKRLRREYANAQNEGGEGYIPHFYTYDELSLAESDLKQLLTKLDQLKEAL